MKKKTAISFILLMIFFYIVWSFCMWDFNPNHWNIGVRIIYACTSIWLSGMVTALNYK